jgi:DNA-binding response OmpR family regulator
MNRPLPPTVLIDDDPDVLASLTEVFRAWPCPSVVCHESPFDAGADAFEAGLVVCDYRFPGASGVEWIREMRERGCRTPVLLLSGAPDQGAVLEASGLDACRFLAKPFSLDQLGGALRGLLEGRWT